ncbi:MAG: NADH:ubiquinone oxidoreductase [Desulfobulbaceae bacterium DB1]|nr:MAG: NADH:ubiquinone oxidoreductase [Desulfobulbaceae bacterium DB1]
MQGDRTYLGVPIRKPRAAFFEFTSCEGCQLQMLNNEASLLDFLGLLEIVNFREAMSEQSDVYEIAFVEGSISRADEEEMLKKIRAQAKTLVAVGSCACFGGVNQLKNRFDDLDWVKKEVYGDNPVDTRPVQPLSAIVPVDLHIYGCPIKKEEVEKIVTNFVLGKAVHQPKYPVCMECKANHNICLFDLGEPCLGPVTRAGCDAWCPGNRLGCWGCRGPAEEANVGRLAQIMKEHGFSRQQMIDRLECFGGFSAHVRELKQGT